MLVPFGRAVCVVIKKNANELQVKERSIKISKAVIEVHPQHRYGRTALFLLFYGTYGATIKRAPKKVLSTWPRSAIRTLTTFDINIKFFSIYKRDRTKITQKILRHLPVLISRPCFLSLVDVPFRSSGTPFQNSTGKCGRCVK